MGIIGKAGTCVALAGVLLLGGRSQGVSLCGDCNGDGVVTAAEAMMCLNIVLGSVLLKDCQACDCNMSGQVTGMDVEIAQNNATPGCCPNNVVCQCGMPTGTPGELATDTPTLRPTATTTPLPTNTSMLPPPATSTPTHAGTPLPTGTPGPCVGDCNHDLKVTIDEIIKGVNIALGSLAPGACPAFDCHGNGQVTVDCLVRAVNAALNGCV
jgi:hypothetical protein